MGPSVDRVTQLRKAWWEAHQQLRTFVEPYTDYDRARTLASGALGRWVQAAGDGMQPTCGPYGHMFSIAYTLLIQGVTDVEPPTYVEAERTIPMHQSLLPYQVAKVYSDIWKACQLLVWDRQAIHRVSKAVSELWPVSDSGWAALEGDWDRPLIPPLARCAVEILDEHTCVDCETCGQHAVRWENADACTERWFTGRRLQAEGVSCPTQERSPSG